MAEGSRSLTPQPSGDTFRYLIIVTRDLPDLSRYITLHFAGFKRVQVLLDRRLGERRQRVQTYESDRRRANRRRPPSLENTLRHRPFVIVTQ